MEIKNIKNFIWDFDGTLFDTYPYTIDCFIKALGALGHTAEWLEVYSLMMESIPCAFREYGERYKLGPELREAYMKIYKSDPVSQGEPFPRSADILKRVIENGGGNYMFTHRVEDVYDFLKYWNFSGYFREVVTLADGFPPKPAPDAINYLIDKYAFDKSETLMIGDREIDVQSGSNAGVLTCHVTNGLPYKEFTVDLRVSGLEELFKMIEVSIER
jgi:phosphoglycolate phosphatase-like HAD superfamily hydrolase